MTAITTPKHTARTLDELLVRIDEVSTIPSLIRQLIEVSENALSDTEELSRVIESNSRIAACVLEYANAVVEDLRQPITTCTRAINHLSVLQVRNLALTAAIGRIFHQKEIRIGTYSRQGLWLHLACVAITAQMIAEENNVLNPQEIFLAGLFHDLGIVIEDEFQHNQFIQMMDDYPVGYTLLQAERPIFGFGHTSLGFCVARHWNLPQTIRAAIRHHHDKLYDGPQASAVACVELANVLCTRKGIGSVGQPLEYLSPSVMSQLGVDRDEIKPLIQRMNDRLDQNQLFLHLAIAW
jgi:putative nucleotidyltransferase with HDIG domain